MEDCFLEIGMLKLHDSFSSCLCKYYHRGQSFFENELIAATHSRSWAQDYFYSDDFQGNYGLAHNFRVYFLSICWKQNC